MFVFHIVCCVSLVPVLLHCSRLISNNGDAENARPENDGQRKLWVWRMQEWKMTDKNYGVWKMQDWKMTDKLLANCEHNYVCIFDVYLANYRKTLLQLD